MSQLENLSNREQSLGTGVIDKNSLPIIGEPSGTLSLQPGSIDVPPSNNNVIIEEEMPVQKRSFVDKIKDAVKRPFRRKKKTELEPGIETGRNYPNVISNPEKPPNNLGGRDLEEIDMEDYDYYDIDEDNDDLDYETRGSSLQNVRAFSTNSIPLERETVVRHEHHEGTIPHCSHFHENLHQGNVHMMKDSIEITKEPMYYSTTTTKGYVNPRIEAQGYIQQSGIYTQGMNTQGLSINTRATPVYETTQGTNMNFIPQTSTENLAEIKNREMGGYQ